MNKLLFVVSLLLSPGVAFARGSSGVGSIIIIAAMLCFAYVVILVIFGGPPALINKLSGRKPSDEIGGKVFALSFAVAPFISAPLMYLFGKENAAIGFITGYFIAVYGLNYYLSNSDKQE